MAQLDSVATAAAHGGRGPFANAVHGEDGRLLEGTGKEGAGGVGLMVLAEDIALLIALSKPPIHLPGEPQFLSEPERHGQGEGAEAGGSKAQIGLEQTLKLEERLVVETDIVNRLRREPGLLQAVVDSMDREVRVVLLTSEALLLSGGGDFAVHHQGRSRIVIEG